jgi:hypothetical protein
MKAKFIISKTKATNHFFLILLFIICGTSSNAQTENQQLNSDPEKAGFVTRDIDNFWRAFDLAAEETDRKKKIAIYQRDYLDKGSAGLRDFVRMRIKSAENLFNTIEKLPNFYASVRQSTLRVREMERQMRKSFRQFKRIYPEALFPDVYFVIGIANTGGTASENGLLIGTELYGLTDKTPRDEFVELFRNFMPNAKEKTELRSIAAKYTDVALKPIEGIPAIVAHESCHFNQKYPPLESLLAKAIQEGACDFIGEKISGNLMNPTQKTYGEKHEAELWHEFQTAMTGRNQRNWMYNALTAKTRPPDLGYFIGYKISQSYYRNAKDKRQAIRDILQIKDFSAFLRQSLYRQ